jgi:putative flippase GtrA
MINRQFVTRVFRFGVTGVLTTGFHVSIAVAMFNLVAPSQAIANGAAFIVATIFSYIVNTLWSFSTTIRRKNLLRYFFIASICFVVSIEVSEFAESMGVDYLLGIGAVAMIVPIISFILHQLWTYRQS